MPSSFLGNNLFGSGPHRFRVLAQGEMIVQYARLNPTQPGSFAAGPLELAVVVSGRLVASSESGLWTLRDAIAAKLTDPPLVGTLVDLQLRTWVNMSFVRFESGDRTDRGRVVSLAYEALFVRFLGS